MTDLIRRITLKTDEKFHRQVRVKAAEDGIPVAEVVRRLLALWLAGAVVLAAPPETTVDRSN